jgi:exosortase
LEINSTTTVATGALAELAGRPQLISARPDGSLNHWTTPRLVGLLALVALGYIAMRGAWEEIFRYASTDEEASHIWLVPFLAGWLVWVRRSTLAKAIPVSSICGPIVVALGWALAHWGYYGPRQSPFHLGAVLVFVGCVWTCAGTSVLRSVWPAVLVLIFLVPVPGMARQRISLPLEQVTAMITTHVLRWFELPVTRAVNQISINNVPVTVAEACNGLRMLFPLFLIVYVFCFTVPLRTGVRWLLILTSPISAIACNVVRLLPTMLLYGYAPKEWAQRFHDYSGWAMVPIAFLVLMGIVKVMRAMGIPVLQEAAALPSTAGEGCA